MPNLLSTLLFGGLLPALVTAAVLLVVWWASGRLDSKLRGGLAVALGLGLGDLAGHLGVAWPSWPPTEVTDRIPWLVGVAILAGVFETLGPARRWMPWVNRVCVSWLTIVAIVGPAFGEAWLAPTTVLGGALLGIVMALAWANLDAVAVRCSGVGIFLPLLLVTGGASVALLVSGSIVLPILGGVLSAVIAASGLVSWRIPAICLARSGTPVVVVTLASLLLINRVYAELPSASVALFAAAPASLWLTQLGPIRRRAGWLRVVVGTFAVLIPVAIAVGLAVAAMPSYEY